MTELALYLQLFLACQGDALNLEGDIYQHYRVVDYAIQNVDFAVVLDGQYIGFASQAFCSLVGDGDYQLRLRVEETPGYEYWSSGFMDLQTYIYKGGFE